MSQIKRATSLSELGEVTVEVEVQRPDGVVLAVPLRTLTEAKMREIRASVVWPTPPVVDMKKVGGEVVNVYDRNDPAYLAADREADALLSYKALLAALDLDIPGDTEAERLAALQNGLGAYAFAVLLTAVNRINVISPEEIAQVARSFQRRRPAGAPGNGAAGADAQPVAEPAAG